MGIFSRGACAAALAALAVTAACGGSEKDVGPELAKLCDDPDGPWAAYQAKIAMCAPGVAGSYQRAWGRQPTHAEQVEACRKNLEPYLKDNTIAAPDQAELDACTEWLDATDCDDFDPSEGNPCRSLLVGVVGGGSYCERDEQCVGDGYCADAHGTSCGGCKTRGGEGATCSYDNQCASGYCAGTACAAPGAVGATCTSSHGCLGQLVCADGLCAAAPNWAVDTPCTPGDLYQCVSSNGLLECGAESKCVAIEASTPGEKDEGAACAESAECGPLLVCFQQKCQYAPYSGYCPAY
jgi:hypothetical protein